MLVLALLTAWLLASLLTAAAWSRWRRVDVPALVPWLDREEEFWTDDEDVA